MQREIVLFLYTIYFLFESLDRNPAFISPFYGVFGFMILCGYYIFPLANICIYYYCHIVTMSFVPSTPFLRWCLSSL